MLATVRTGDNDNTGLWLQLPRPDSVRRIAVPPMSVGALHAVLADRLDRSFSRPTMLRIEEASRGNPFYALEIARMMDDHEAHTEISLPDSLKELIRSKVRGGDSSVDDALLAVACLATPTVGLVARALGADLNIVAAQLEAAESRGIIDIDGAKLRFSHPIFALFNSGRLDASLRCVEEAVEKAEKIGRPDLLSQALGMRAMVRLLHGHGLDEPGLQRALELEDHQANIPFALRPSVHNAILRSCTGELDWAHEQITSLRRRCIEHGQDGELMLVAFHDTLVEIWRGRFAEAALIAEDTMELAQQLGGDLPLSVALTCRALLAAYLGRVDEARTAVDDARAANHRCGSDRLGEWPTTALGFLEVSLGDYEAALHALSPLLARVEMMPDATEIIAASFIPDAVEALVALDRLEPAEQLVTALERNGSRLRRDWMLAVGSRGRAMVTAARGDIATGDV